MQENVLRDINELVGYVPDMPLKARATGRERRCLY